MTVPDGEKDQSIEGFLRLLQRANGNPRDKLAALEALGSQRVTVASWEPQAEGFRTLVNASGEEALAVFSSKDELHAAAVRFGWLDGEGGIAIRETQGGDIIRHAWTREYDFVVVDVASSHSVEYARAELEPLATQEIEQTGKFRTSRPPPRPKSQEAPAEVPKPRVNIEAASTQYHLTPPIRETLSVAATPHKASGFSGLPKRESKDPAMTVEVSVAVNLSPSNAPPNKPSIPRRRSSAKPLRKKVATPAIEEVQVDPATLGAGGTYGAATVIPSTQKPSLQSGASATARVVSEFDTTDPGAPFLQLEESEQRPALAEPRPEAGLAPPSLPHEEELHDDDVLDDHTHAGELHDDDVFDDHTHAGEIQANEPIVDAGHDGELHDDDVFDDRTHAGELPANEPIVDAGHDGELHDDDVFDDRTRVGEIRGNERVVDEMPNGATPGDRIPRAGIRVDDDTQPVDIAGPALRKAKRLKERSIHDSIELAPLPSAPGEELLKDLSQALRNFPEIDWAAICLMNDGGRTAPTIGLRIADNYRENVDYIVEAVVRASEPHALDLDLLLIDGHDLIRKARESAFVFFPWAPKVFGG
jgi:hypothetical protein